MYRLSKKLKIESKKNCNPKRKHQYRLSLDIYRWGKIQRVSQCSWGAHIHQQQENAESNSRHWAKIRNYNQWWRFGGKRGSSHTFARLVSLFARKTIFSGLVPVYSRVPLTCRDVYYARMFCGKLFVVVRGSSICPWKAGFMQQEEAWVCVFSDLGFGSRTKSAIWKSWGPAQGLELRHWHRFKTPMQIITMSTLQRCLQE